MPPTLFREKCCAFFSLNGIRGLVSGATAGNEKDIKDNNIILTSLLIF